MIACSVAGMWGPEPAETGVANDPPIGGLRATHSGSRRSPAVRGVADLVADWLHVAEVELQIRPPDRLGAAANGTSPRARFQCPGNASPQGSD